MFIILPNNSTKEKNLNLINILNANDIEQMIEKATYKSATIIIPKFHVEQTSDIQYAMQKMGVKTLFDPQESDLSLLTIQKRYDKKSNSKSKMNKLEALDRTRSLLSSINTHIYVDTIIHKIVLTVDEFGTEGGAVTGSAVNKIGSSVLFLAQKPFLFLIRHNATKLPLFYGAVFEPSINK